MNILKKLPKWEFFIFLYFFMYNKKEDTLLIKGTCYMQSMMTLENFIELINCSGPVFGKLLIEVTKREDGYKIVALDHDEFNIVNKKGEVVLSNQGSTTQIIGVFLDRHNRASFIEHNFGAFTKANQTSVLNFVNLVGVPFDIDSFAPYLMEEEKK